jgi:glycosyltransferase involved in cell wall biosynthesis
MTLGCPVAAANAASLPEVCGEAAFYFDPHSAEAIGAALRRIVDDEALRARLRDAGRVRATQFSWSASAERLRSALARSLAAA